DGAHASSTPQYNRSLTRSQCNRGATPRTRERSMSRIVLFVLAAAAAVPMGCGRNEPTPPGASTASVEALPAVGPPSGGALVLIPAGTFAMGDAAGRPDEPPHRVAVAAFYLDRYPVTQELHEKVLGVNPSKRKDPKNPVERTQWTDAARFC